MKCEELRAIYKYKTIEECADLWIALCSVLKEESLLSEKYEIAEDEFKTINQIEKVLNKETDFGISDNLFSFSFGSVWSAKIQQLIVTQQKDVKVKWDIWLRKLGDFGKFVYAWKYNEVYDFWQNNDSIESYKRNGILYDHLPMKPSGEPLPFPQIEIDTSKNPGRNVFKTGYVEAVGSTMWLGDEFFALTGANKETVKNSKWLETTELKPGILKIKAQEECFTQSEGKEAELQNKMRDLLYPNHQ